MQTKVLAKKKNACLPALRPLPHHQRAPGRQGGWHDASKKGHATGQAIGMHTSIRSSQAKPAGSQAAARQDVCSAGDKDLHRTRETHNVSVLTHNNERRDHGRDGHDATLYQCPVFLLSLALGLPRPALRHRVVSRFCRVQESLPCQALGVCGRHATVCHHDRHPLGLALVQGLRHAERPCSY